MALLAALGFALSGVFVRMAGPRVAVLTGTAVSVVASLTIAVIPAIVLELPALQRISIAGFLWILLLAFVNYPLGRSFVLLVAFMVRSLSRGLSGRAA